MFEREWWACGHEICCRTCVVPSRCSRTIRNRLASPIILRNLFGWWWIISGDRRRSAEAFALREYRWFISGAYHSLNRYQGLSASYRRAHGLLLRRSRQNVRSQRETCIKSVRALCSLPTFWIEITILKYILC